MKNFKLCTGQVITVDDEDAELVERFKWRVAPNGYVYATIYLHRLVKNVPRTMQVDHVDRNKLNNQRGNLEPVSSWENLMRKRRRKVIFDPRHRKITESRFMGVSRLGAKWRAYISKNKVQRHLGVFDTETEAALAYNKAAIALHGSKAFQNEV